MKKLIPLVFIGVFFVGCKDQDKESPEDKGNNNSSQVVEEGPDLSGIEYNLSGDSAFITKCTRVGQVIVPSVIENLAVTGIGDNAFFGNIGHEQALLAVLCSRSYTALLSEPSRLTTGIRLALTRAVF